MISSIKDFFEDLKRRKQDEKENSRPISISQDGKFVKIPSSFLRVGHVVKIFKNQYFPCDLVLLRSSNKSNFAYVSTKQLDGESSMKLKFINKDISGIFHSDQEVISLHTILNHPQCQEDPIKVKRELRYIPPNPYLNKFFGNLI